MYKSIVLITQRIKIYLQLRELTEFKNNFSLEFTRAKISL